jgi:hypothetical protein
MASSTFFPKTLKIVWITGVVLSERTPTEEGKIPKNRG